MQRISNRTLDGLVVLGERTVGQSAERHENASHALRIHDERAHVLFGLRVGFEIGNVVTYPLLRRLVPPDLLARGVVGFAGEIAGRAVVEHAAIGRP